MITTAGYMMGDESSEGMSDAEIESFILDKDMVDENFVNSPEFFLTHKVISESLLPQDMQQIDPETQERLQALLQAAGIGRLAPHDAKNFADPAMLKRLSNSVTSALEDAAAAAVGAAIAPASRPVLTKSALDPDPFETGVVLNESNEEGDSLLSLACSAGYYELAQVLLAMHTNVEDRGVKGDCTPLHEASSAGHVDIVKLLIHHGADINAKSSTGNTGLMYACASGHTEVVKALLDAGACLSIPNDNGHTPLMEAASAGFVDVAKLLISHGASTNTHSNEFKESPLTLACYKGHLDMVQYLLSLETTRANRADELHTALMEASMDGHVEVARLLLDNGAEVNMPADSFESPLTLAACGGHTDLAKLLLERGANIEEVNDEGYTPLQEAAREGHEDMVALLLSYNADVNAQTDETGETALTLASCSGFSEVVALLIKAGANLEMGSNTPLHEASQEGHLDVVHLLIKEGANVNAIASTGDSALTYAAENGHRDVCVALVQAGAKLNHCASEGRTALMKAARVGHENVLQYLILAGADVNRTTINNEHTALSFACSCGFLSCAELLLRHGANPNHKLKDSSTMLIEAAKGGYTNIVQLLLDWPGTHLASQLPKPAAKGLPTLANLSVEALANHQKQRLSAAPPMVSSLKPTAVVDGNINNLQTEDPMVSVQKTLLKRAGELTNAEIQQLQETLRAQFQRAANYAATQSVATQLPVSPGQKSHVSVAARKSSKDSTVMERVHGIADGVQKTGDVVQQKATKPRATSTPGQAPPPPPPPPQQLHIDAAVAQAMHLEQLKLEQVRFQQLNVENQTLAEQKAQLQQYLQRQQALLQEAIPMLPPLTSGASLTDVSSAIAALSANAMLPLMTNPSLWPLLTQTVEDQQALGAVTNTATAGAADVSYALDPAQFPMGNNALPHMMSPLVQDFSTMSDATPFLELPSAALPVNLVPPLDISLPVGLGIPTTFATTTTPTASLAGKAQQLPRPPASLPGHPQVASLPAVTHAHVPHSHAVPQPAATLTKATTSTATSSSRVDLNTQTESNHDTALTLASAGGHADLVSLLLRHGSAIEHRDKKGFTPLMLAATAGHVRVVEALLEHGADLEAQSERTKDSALSLACSGGKKETVEVLLKRAANKEHRNVSDYTPLSLAASGGFVDVINLLLAYGAEINSRTGSKLGISPLMLASMNGHAAAVKLLLEKGADVNAQIETNRNTAVTLACFQGRHEVVKLLLEYRANYEHRAKTGLTPLMEAASGGYVEVGKLLADFGADVNAAPVPSSKDTALTIAADKGHCKFVDMLVKYGASIDVKNKKCQTSLWLAANGGHLDVVQVLVRAGANLEAQDNRKITPLMAAFRKGHVKVVKWLVRHVSQFPSDQECLRYIQTLSDKDLLDKCKESQKVIAAARERQAAEAFKNARILLEQIEQEEQLAATRKQAKQKKQEKKRQKRHAKKVQQPNDDLDDALRNDDNDNEDDDGEQAIETSVDALKSLTSPQKSGSPQPEVAPVSSGATSKSSSPDRLVLPRTPSPPRVPEVISPVGAAPVKSPGFDQIAPSLSPPQITSAMRRSPLLSAKNQRLNRRKHSPEQARKPDAMLLQVNAAVTPSSGEAPKPKPSPRAVNSVNNENEGWSNATKSRRIAQQQLRSSRVSTAVITRPSRVEPPTASYRSERDRTDPKRRQDKLYVSAQDIARVIGRSGNNINAIRESTGAHIEVEKQQTGQTQRLITLRGSTEAVQQAIMMINGLIIDQDAPVQDIVSSVRNKDKYAMTAYADSREKPVAPAAPPAFPIRVNKENIKPSTSAVSATTASGFPEISLWSGVARSGTLAKYEPYAAAGGRNPAASVASCTFSKVQMPSQTTTVMSSLSSNAEYNAFATPSVWVQKAQKRPMNFASVAAHGVTSVSSSTAVSNGPVVAAASSQKKFVEQPTVHASIPVIPTISEAPHAEAKAPGYRASLVPSPMPPATEYHQTAPVTTTVMSSGFSAAIVPPIRVSPHVSPPQAHTQHEFNKEPVTNVSFASSQLSVGSRSSTATYPSPAASVTPPPGLLASTPNPRGVGAHLQVDESPLGKGSSSIVGGQVSSYYSPIQLPRPASATASLGLTYGSDWDDMLDRNVGDISANLAQLQQLQSSATSSSMHEAPAVTYYQAQMPYHHQQSTTTSNHSFSIGASGDTATAASGYGMFSAPPPMRQQPAPSMIAAPPIQNAGADWFQPPKANPMPLPPQLPKQFDYPPPPPAQYAQPQQPTQRPVQQQRGIQDWQLLQGPFSESFAQYQALIQAFGVGDTDLFGVCADPGFNFNPLASFSQPPPQNNASQTSRNSTGLYAGFNGAGPHFAPPVNGLPQRPAQSYGATSMSGYPDYVQRQSHVPPTSDSQWNGWSPMSM